MTNTSGVLGCTQGEHGRGHRHHEGALGGPPRRHGDLRARCEVSETAWLIEFPGPLFWSGREGCGALTGANDALRFARWQDADRMRIAQGFQDAKCTEHMWYRTPAPSDAARTEGDVYDCREHGHDVEVVADVEEGYMICVEVDGDDGCGRHAHLCEDASHVRTSPTPPPMETAAVEELVGASVALLSLTHFEKNNDGGVNIIMDYPGQLRDVLVRLDAALTRLRSTTETKEDKG